MKIPKYYLLFTMLITGASILVIEILGARIISPFFGVSLYVWSALISVTLISLAIGYWRGGIIADSEPDEDKLYTIIFQSAVCLLIIPFIKTFVLSRMGFFGLRIGALLSASILFAAPLILLSMVTPYAVRLTARKIEGVGRTTGMLYAISTVGSFVGAIIAGFFLIPVFHADKVVYLLSLILAVLVVVPWLLNRKPLKAVLAMGLIIVCLFLLFHAVKLPQAAGMKVIYKAESLYGEIKVLDTASDRSLLISGIVQGRVNTSGYPIDNYFYYMDGFIQTYRPDVKDSLVVGLGAGSLPRILGRKKIKVDTVEIDPVIGDVAKRFFGFNEGKLYIEDSRYYIANTLNTYDHIFLDAFGSEMLPYHLFSIESFMEMKKILKKGGILTINFHDFKDTEKAISTQSILKTLRKVFSNVLVFDLQPWYGGIYRNIAFIASMEELIPKNQIVKIEVPAGMPELRVPKPIDINIKKGVVLSDGYNPIQRIYNPVAEAMRSDTLKAFPPEIFID